MTTPHKATADQWEKVEYWAKSPESGGAIDSCILELRDRIEALEAAQREAAMNELRAASAEARPTVKESLTDASSLVKRRPLRCPTPATIAECGGPCEQSFHLCDCGLLEQLNPELKGPAPASSLVGRVADAIAITAAADTEDHDLYQPEARAAIRAVAGWLRDRGGYPWAWVAQVLEKEASR